MSDSNDHSHASLSRSFIKSWKGVLALGLVLAVLASVIVMMTFTKQYEATALLQIEEKTPSIVYQTGERSSRYVQTQVELLRSPVVLGPVLGRRDVASIKEIREQGFPLRWLQRQVGVRNINETELFEVSFTNPDPQAAARVVNDVISTYLDIQSEAEYRRNLKVIDLLRKEKQDRQDAVDELRQKIKNLAERVTGVEVFSSSEVDVVLASAAAELTRLRQQISDRVVQQQVLQANITTIAQQSPEELRAMIPDRVRMALETHPEIVQQTRRLGGVAGKLKRKSLEDVDYESTSDYIETLVQLKKEQESLDELKLQVAQSIRDPKSVLQDESRASRVASLLLSLKINDAELEVLDKILEDRLQALGKTERKSIELEFSRAELAREERVFEMIADRKLMLETENDAPARVYLRKEATVPRAAIEEVPYRRILIFSSGAFLLPFVLSVLAIAGRRLA